MARRNSGVRSSGFVRGIGSKAFVFLACATLLALAVSPDAVAQPANDTCADAITIQCGDTVSGDTSIANPESLGFCGTSDGSGGAVWYRFVGTGEDTTVTTCNSGSDYDTKLRVFENGCGTLDCVTGNDDASCGLNGLFSTVTWSSVSGVEYLILVHGFGDNEGNFELTITCATPPPAGGNDDCIDATPVTDGSYSGSTPPGGKHLYWFSAFQARENTRR